MKTSRAHLIELAQKGLRMPIIADVVLCEEADPEAVRQDPEKLALVLEKTARRFGTPLALPLMDLSLEIGFLGQCLGVPQAQRETFHLEEPPAADVTAKVKVALKGPLPPLMDAGARALTVLERNAPDLVPCGMTIGPFSLATKLLADPIVAVAMAGSGLTAEDDDDVALFETALDWSMAVIERNLSAQLEAGAGAIFVAEPAANLVYISPKQMEAGSDIFERYVMVLNRRIRDLIEGAGAQLLFHCCGELTDEMIRQFAALRPAVLSLGSFCKLWEIEPLVPKDVVLFGNLPSKKFFSGKEITVEQVEALSRELLAEMGKTKHPFILGSECDILCVHGCHDEIVSKVDAFLKVK